MTMLTGRESLIRLVGRRRRFLPNIQSILSSANQGSKIEVEEANGVEGIQEINGGDDVAETAVADMVNCPVCGDKVRGEDYMINSHLDACLSRGKKRKLSQRTLVQFNFCSKPKVKSDSGKLDHTQCDQTEHDSNSMHVVNDLFDLGTKIHRNIQHEASSSTAVVSITDTLVSDEIPSSLGGTNCSIDSTVNDREKLSSPFPLPEDSDILGKTLQTFIVGRRHSEEMEIICGASISLCREPDNAKDPNAIKVLSSESGCGKMLGYIPRELAQYLSPLMDMFGLSFEGHLTSVVERSAPVPIEIWCQGKISFDEKNCESLDLFESMSRNALAVVRSGDNSPSGRTKYQQNFVLLLKEVLRTSPHLFTCEEISFLERFGSLSDDSQRLFLRLYSRKGPWFRMSSVSYTEIKDCQQARKGLSEAGYLCSNYTMSKLNARDFEGVLNVLTVSELHEILCVINKRCSRGRSLRKEESIASLLSMHEGGSSLSLQNMVLEKAGHCVRISPMAESLAWRVERLFFLNGEQDLSSFLLVDLGIVKYPTYNIIVSEQIFSSRDDLLSYEEALEVAQTMDQSLDDNNLELVVKCIEISNSRIPSSSIKATQSSTSKTAASFGSHFSASWVYSKVVLLGVSFYENKQRYDDAIDLLRRLLNNFSSDRRRGYWTLRLSIDLEHVGRLNESLSVAETGLLDPWVRAGSRISLQRRVLRLGKPPRRWKIPSYAESVKRKISEVHVQGRPLNCKTGTKSRFYDEDGEQCGVEQLALQYYAGEGGGWQGLHTESGIWLTVFGLLMWDAIFADVPNVFHTRFQNSPLDLETDGFYEVRENILEPLLQKIKEGMAEEILITSWESHLGTACRGINWDRHSLSELRAVVTCVGGRCLASICRHLAQDYRNWSSGMPDLLLWRFHGDYSGEAKLVEVKGPRDRLSEQQRAWLLFLMDAGFNVEICRVSPPLPTS